MNQSGSAVFHLLILINDIVKWFTVCSITFMFYFFFKPSILNFFNPTSIYMLIDTHSFEKNFVEFVDTSKQYPQLILSLSLSLISTQRDFFFIDCSSLG